VPQTMTKTTIAALIYSFTLPKLLNIISSLVIIVYFISMLKFNIVDRKYNGQWKLFFKAWFKANRK